MKIAVITPSIPSRSSMLAEACESVAGQTLAPECHLIATGLPRSKARNSLAKSAYFDLGCDWLAFLDDDDLLHPDHLEKLATAAEYTHADMVYSRCEVKAEPGVSHPDISTWNRIWDRWAIQHANWIPVTVLMRATTFLDLDGFKSAAEPREDWDLWQRLAEADGAVGSITDVTWIYRFHRNDQMAYR